jgi:hypothetical protein
VWDRLLLRLNPQLLWAFNHKSSLLWISVGLSPIVLNREGRLLAAELGRVRPLGSHGRMEIFRLPIIVLDFILD